jgi:magnesium transporter
MTRDVVEHAPELPALSDLLAAKHAAETAAAHVVTRVPLGYGHELVGAVIARLAEHDLDATDAVYVVGRDGELAGAIRLPDLLRASRHQPLAELVDAGYPRVYLDDDQEAVAAQVLERNATSAAVVDARGKLVGAVTAAALLKILRHEHVEDLHRLAGIQRETAQTRSALESAPIRRARHRLPWLIVGLVGSMLAAGVMSRFEHVLETQLAIAFFVPTIVYLADAIGTQTVAITVRGLSLSGLSLGHLLSGELRTGLFIGLTLAVLAFPLVALITGDMRLGLAISSAIVVAGSVATSIGLVMPWFLQRIGSDPAFGSGPVATIIQDVLSLLIYFAIASLLVR